MEETIEGDPSSEDIGDAAWVPKVDMEFRTDEAAYQFYNDYARIVGFSVRKAWINRRASGTVISRTYVCYKEGYQGNRKDESEVKKPRQNERTGCLAHLTIKLSGNGGYRISEFHPMHNHELVPATNAHTLRSHRVAKKPRIVYGDAGSQKVNLECLVRQAGGYRQVHFISLEEAANRGWAPKADMEFESDERAYQFYYDYARRVGFDVRKAWINRRPSGVIVSRTYVCYKEGFYGNKKDENQVQQHTWRLSDRTGCPAKMTIKLSSNGRYRVTEFQPMHNHEFVTARTAHTLKSHRPSKKNRSGGMELLNEPSIGHKITNTHLSQKSLLVQDTSLSIQDKQCIPEKSACSLSPGELGAALQYMQERQADDPSFYYSVQIDNSEQFSNIFWTDGNCMADYHFFGDVVCCDTTYEVGIYGRPLALFYGVNHHKQITIFGMTLLYNETEESFKWLFETFTTAMSGKPPTVILTNRNPEIHNAITTVWPGTTHRVCSWHIYHYAAKHLPKVFQGSKTFASDFSRCVYDCEEEEEFIAEWVKMLEKYNLKDNKLLKQLFDERQSWAMPYQREIFCADIKRAQQTECLQIMLKVHLKPGHDLLQFLEVYGKAINERRAAQLFTDLRSTESNSILASSRMLRQAASVYTPEVFDMFQKELEMSMDCLVYSSDVLGTIYEYKVKSEESPEHLVSFNTLDSSVVCSCKRFEFVGIQCRHVLKVLDIINIKELPPRYFLKRWRKDAKLGFSRDKHVPSIDIHPASTKARRFSSLCYMFNILATKAAETTDGYRYILSQADQLLNSVFQIVQYFHKRQVSDPFLYALAIGPQGSNNQCLDGCSIWKADVPCRHEYHTV